jgi:hypothetical protein
MTEGSKHGKKLKPINRTNQEVMKMARENNSNPDGTIRIHLYSYHNVLKPRGSMQKESLGLIIYERLTDVFDDWTNPKYGDNPSEDKLLKQLRKNLWGEVEAAWNKLITNKGKGGTNVE